MQLQTSSCERASAFWIKFLLRAAFNRCSTTWVSREAEIVVLSTFGRPEGFTPWAPAFFLPSFVLNLFLFGLAWGALA